MKLAPSQNRTPMVDAEGRITPIWAKWLNYLVDSPVREVKDAKATPTAPEMKKGEMIVFKCTHSSVNKNYIVFYDGTNHEYWESTGTDVY